MTWRYSTATNLFSEGNLRIGAAAYCGGGDDVDGGDGDDVDDDVDGGAGASVIFI